MSQTQLVESTENAISKEVEVARFPRTIHVTGLQGADEVIVNISADDGETFPEGAVIGGAPVVLTAANNVVTLRDGGKYRLDRAEKLGFFIKIAIYTS